MVKDVSLILRQKLLALDYLSLIAGLGLPVINLIMNTLQNILA